ncbi:MAG: hypothetical protein PHE33_12545 [Bacteroidales bacterium]|nr:hypothetical protein [Bacteroidales bacterium]
MKNKIKSFSYLSVAVFASFIILIVGCSAPNEKTNDATENLIDAKKDLDKAQENYDEMYEEYRDVVDRKISENKKTIADLRKEINNKEAKAELEKRLLELEHENQSLKEKIRDYKNDDVDKWELFKNEFNNDMKNLQQSLKDLVNSNSNSSNNNNSE